MIVYPLGVRIRLAVGFAGMALSKRWNTLTLIGYKSASEFLCKLSSFFLLVLASRFLSTKEFGILSLGFATGWILSVATDFGLQMYLAREVAKAPKVGEALYLRLFRVRVLLIVLGLAAAAMVSLVTGGSAYVVAFLLLTASQLTNSLIEFINHYYRGISQSQVESTVNILHRLATLALAGAVLLAGGALLGLALALLLLSLLSLAFSFRYSLKLARLCRPDADDSRMNAPGFDSSLFWREVFPIGFGIFMSVLYFRVDLYLVELWRGIESVALYNAVFRLVEALRFVPAAVLAVVFPELCRQPRSRVLSASTLSMAVLATVIAVAAIWQGPRLVTLAFGPEFMGAVPAFRILLLALPFLFVNFVLTHQIIASDLQTFFAVFCGAGLIFNLTLNLWLIRIYGIEGAAVSTVATEVCLTAAWGWVLLRGQGVSDRTPVSTAGEEIGGLNP